jgi:hypothetical protein
MNFLDVEEFETEEQITEEEIFEELGPDFELPGNQIHFLNLREDAKRRIVARRKYERSHRHYATQTESTEPVARDYLIEHSFLLERKRQEYKEFAATHLATTARLLSDVYKALDIPECRVQLDSSTHQLRERANEQRVALENLLKNLECRASSAKVIYFEC